MTKEQKADALLFFAKGRRFRLGRGCRGRWCRRRLWQRQRRRMMMSANGDTE
jgi:hypothetical protein